LDEARLFRRQHLTVTVTKKGKTEQRIASGDNLVAKIVDKGNLQMSTIVKVLNSPLFDFKTRTEELDAALTVIKNSSLGPMDNPRVAEAIQLEVYDLVKLPFGMNFKGVYDCLAAEFNSDEDRKSVNGGSKPFVR